MPNLLKIDYFLSNFFSNLIPHNSFFNNFFSFFSLKGSSIFIWILVIVLVVILEERKSPGLSIRDKKFMLMFSSTFISAFFVADILVKNIVRRPRPYLLMKSFYSNLVVGICPTNFSFPSAHAATSFAAAGILAHFDKKRSWLYYLVAVLISYSRIYLGCHYFLDVLFGGLLGYFLSKAFIYIKIKVKNG